MIDYNAFYKRIIISEEEKKKSLYYIKYRGFSEHIFVLDFLENICKDKISYSEIATTFRYDKRLRTIIYKYIGFIEEYIRALISNEYINDLPNSLKTIEYINTRCNSINTYEALKDMSFGQLIKLLDNMPKKLINNLSSYSYKNMRMIVSLRNAVSHNRFILNFDEYFKNTTLKDNVINLYNMLPEFLKENFRLDLKDIQKENKHKENQTDWKLRKEIIIEI